MYSTSDLFGEFIYDFLGIQNSLSYQISECVQDASTQMSITFGRGGSGTEPYKVGKKHLEKFSKQN